MKQKFLITIDKLAAFNKDISDKITNSQSARALEEVDGNDFAILKYLLNFYVTDNRPQDGIKIAMQGMLDETAEKGRNKFNSFPSVSGFDKAQIFNIQQNPVEQIKQPFEYNLDYLKGWLVLLQHMPKQNNNLQKVLKHMEILLNKKIDYFSKSKNKAGYEDACEEILHFSNDMLYLSAKYHIDGDLNYFKQASKQTIHKAHYGLDKHRGMKNFLCTLLLAIGTLGFGYIIAAAYQRTFSPKIASTDSGNKLDVLDETIKKLP